MSSTPRNPGSVHSPSSPRTLRKIQNLHDGWTRLESRHPTPLASYDWFASAADAFSSIRTPTYLTLSREDRLVAIAPLGKAPRPLSPYEILASSILREPGELLFDQEEDLADLVQALFDLRHPLHLWRLDTSSAIPELVERESRRRNWVLLREEASIPRVRIESDWETFERDRISSSRRSSFRRLRRKTERALGETPRMIVHRVREEDLGQRLETLYRVEESGWKGRGGSSLSAHHTVRDFFERYARVASRDGRLRLFELSAGGRTLAMQLAEQHANRLWIYKIGHDEQWSGLSPGVQLMHDVVRHGFEEGLEACEFLGSDEPWLQIWANCTNERIGYRLYPPSPSGMAGLVLDGARRYAHSGRNRLVNWTARNRGRREPQPTPPT